MPPGSCDLHTSTGAMTSLTTQSHTHMSNLRELADSSICTFQRLNKSRHVKLSPGREVSHGTWLKRTALSWGLTSAKWKGVFLSSLQPQTLGSPIHTTAPLPALGRLVTHRQHDPCKMTAQGGLSTVKDFVSPTFTCA